MCSVFPGGGGGLRHSGRSASQQCSACARAYSNASRVKQAKNVFQVRGNHTWDRALKLAHQLNCVQTLRCEGRVLRTVLCVCFLLWTVPFCGRALNAGDPAPDTDRCQGLKSRMS